MSEDLDKLRERSITKLDNMSALGHIGALVDLSHDAAYARGADRALYLLDQLERRALTGREQVIVHYFRANAWNVKEDVAYAHGSWAWEHPEREQKILALSRAVAHSSFAELDPMRRCQILTNRANALNGMGRFMDAIEGWDAALSIIPGFAMALANRGYGLKQYGGLLEDIRERALFLLHAHDGLVAACASDAVYDSPDAEPLAERFALDAATYAAAADFDRIRALEQDDDPPLGRGRAEKDYRGWCLKHRLFLNPLNDLGPQARGAYDGLVLPAIRESLEDRPRAATPPPAIAFFNQMKQEYVSARYMLYEGLHDTRLHHSDRGVRLFDTLDYPMHSLATERVRTAYRVAYSLLDKTAFLIDHYWKLGKIADRINFRNVWMEEGKQRLLACFKKHSNLPLRGLFWLSKELFDEQLKQTTAPDARELHDIRNALEHKFLQLHEGWACSLMPVAPASDGLGLSISSDLLEAKALRVMKIARSALIQLALAIGVEERARARQEQEEREQEGLDELVVIGSMPLFDLEDRRKRRDPI
ncbi:LA2681 family HEPN domain-containing protein [Sphingobium yanoikuyae]|uniref:LA2681 family HEPN domain-containing protein n=1 Tax=Sphingobium yanoikuyae TaxID=13690 RepID=UPI00289CBF38|nr:LA2681 family HEPN domain-containing protein [Sphingobium yanoikuyae]